MCSICFASDGDDRGHALPVQRGGGRSGDLVRETTAVPSCFGSDACSSGIVGRSLYIDTARAGCQDRRGKATLMKGLLIVHS
jgi:hypothetical protein